MQVAIFRIESSTPKVRNGIRHLSSAAHRFIVDETVIADPETPHGVPWGRLYIGGVPVKNLEGWRLSEASCLSGVMFVFLPAERIFDNVFPEPDQGLLITDDLIEKPVLPSEVTTALAPDPAGTAALEVPND